MDKSRRAAKPCNFDTRPCAADILSAVEFDHDGKHLATGDRGGRVVVFEHIESSTVILTLQASPGLEYHPLKGLKASATLANKAATERDPPLAETEGQIYLVVHGVLDGIRRTVS